MSKARKILRKARGDVHSELSVAAIYLTDAEADPQVVQVRTHTRAAEIGPGDVSMPGLAERFDTTPRIRFLRSEVSKPKSRTGLVLLSADEGYRIHATRPPYGLTIDAEVSDLDDADMLSFWRAEFSELLS